ncbi:MAG TPA: glutaredoxin family protein [Burkholderiales bacterium]|nr:glutaredoxin family protein [Burkholderiales bacterium]
MKKIIVLCALSVCIPASAQQIHRWVDADGRVHYGDKAPSGVKSAPVQSRISSYAGRPVVSGVPSAGATRPEIKMYTTDWCGYCRQAKAFFARQGIRYTELDVEKSPAAREEYQRMGARGVPVILVGTQRMNGYSEESLAQMLKAAGY